ncbi:hypothetical protein KF728_17050 [Candidatus Obscuribacterales bacterium]|nr:hypothetical protein [Candidatus Obscuribacterales bacterium]
MNGQKEVVLAELSDDSQTERIELVLLNDASGSRVCLKQQSWASGIGWFTQSSVTMSPRQVKQLQRALGLVPSASRQGVSSSRELELDAPTVIPFPGSRSGMNTRT